MESNNCPLCGELIEHTLAQAREEGRQEGKDATILSYISKGRQEERNRILGLIEEEIAEKWPGEAEQLEALEALKEKLKGPND